MPPFSPPAEWTVSSAPRTSRGDMQDWAPPWKGSGSDPRVDPLLDLTEPLEQRPEHGHRQPRAFQEERLESLGVDAQRLDRLGRLDGGHPGLRAQQRHLAEKVSRTERVVPAAHVDLRGPRQDDVHRVGTLAL